MEYCELVFAELIRSIERRRCEVKELISAHQRASVSQAEGLLVRMEQEIAELKRRDKELEQLAQTEDNIHFLKVTSLFLSTVAGWCSELGTTT